MVRIARRLTDAKFRAFRMDLRGCGAGWALARRSLHAGRTADLVAAIRHVQSLCPGSPMTIVGFSLGASLVLKLLGSHDTLPSNLDSAIAIAPPLDLQACSRNLNDGWNRIYDLTFARILRQTVARRRCFVKDFDDIPHARMPNSLYEFDAAFTAPLGGFQSVEEYYRRCSSLHVLPHVKIPTRVLFAEDDPLVPCNVFEHARFSSVTEVFATEHGGHLGFIGRKRRDSPDADWHWMDWRVVDWVQHFDSKLGVGHGEKESTNDSVAKDRSDPA